MLSLIGSKPYKSMLSSKYRRKKNQKIHLLSEMRKSMIAKNLKYLRKVTGQSQEEVAGMLGVSRQTVAKWENGESMPDLVNSMALADLYGVTLDDLVRYDDHDNMPIPPKGKHVFGTVPVNERGQIVIPKAAREIFDIHPGDRLLLLGDEEQGLALVKAQEFLQVLESLERKGNQDE